MTYHKRLAETRLVLRDGKYTPVEKVPLQLTLDRVQVEWLGRAAYLPGRTLHVALAIATQSRLQRSGTVRLKPWVLETFNISRRTLKLALPALEKAGLVSSVRRRGCKPVITVLLVEENTQKLP